MDLVVLHKSKISTLSFKSFVYVTANNICI